MSNSCHMQYGRALRWAWGCLMRSSLIYWEREGEQGEGGERDKTEKRKEQNRERSKSQTKQQQWLTLDKCIRLFNLATTYFQSSVFKFLCVCVCVRHGK